MNSKTYYALVWDNYMGNGYVKEITEKEFKDFNPKTSPYWSVYKTRIEAEISLDEHLMD